jgi:hypothetical protein
MCAGDVRAQLVSGSDRALLSCSSERSLNKSPVPSPFFNDDGGSAATAPTTERGCSTTALGAGYGGGRSRGEE